jgi:hypothetical protein
MFLPQYVRLSCTPIQKPKHIVQKLIWKNISYFLSWMQMVSVPAIFVITVTETYAININPLCLSVCLSVLFLTLWGDTVAPLVRFVIVFIFSNSNNSRSQWPCGLRRRSVAACLLRLWVRIPPRAWMCVASVVYCQVEVSAASWSLVQRSPTECGTSLSVT